MYTTWREIESGLFPQLRALPSRGRATPEAEAAAHAAAPPGLLRAWQARLNTAPVYAELSSNPDAVLNTLRYMFFHMRCGILVCVRAGVVALFAPFANVNYANAFTASLREDLAAYRRNKSYVTARPPEDWLEPERWWLNGGMVCNVMPRNVWGDAHCAEIKAMLAAAGPLPDCDFFINKRDYPHLRADGAEPLSRFIHTPILIREAYTTYAPIVSFYGGTEFADLLMPLTEDWKLADAAPAVPNQEAFLAASPRAVWRGSATGYGITSKTNARLRLLEFAETVVEADGLDVAFTAVNARDKLVENGTKLGFINVTVRCGYMSADEQAARFRYVIYVDGHCAANRYGALMRMARVILKVTSDQVADCGEQWLFHDVRGVCVGGDMTGIAAADHCVIHSDFSNLMQTIEFLNAHPDVAWMLACNAWSRAPTCARMCAAWAGLTACMNAAQADAGVSSHADAIWYSPYEPAYAALGTSAHSGTNAFTNRVR